MPTQNQIQDCASVPFFEGQLVTPEILNGFVNNATLKKGAISSQPVYSSAVTGTYTYATGNTLLITKASHGLLGGDRIKATFSNLTGASGADFNGYYEINVINTDSFQITVVGNELASGGNVQYYKIPSSLDEIIINEVNDVNATTPKKVTIDDLLNSRTDISVVTAEIGVIAGKNGKDLIIEPQDGSLITGATYASTDGYTVTVTKANHNLVALENVVVVECTDSASPTKGENYSGVFIVEAVTQNTFTYVLKKEQFITNNEFQEDEVDVPIVSTGTATYRRIGSVNNVGSSVFQGEVFANGITNLRDDLYVYGKARFGEFVLPKGRAAARPASPEEGQLFYNKDDDLIEIWRRSEAFPLGSWETFDKVSSTIIIPAQYSQFTIVAETTNTWYSKTYWTYPTPIPYLQYEIELPNIRLRHDNVDDNGTVLGKLELIAKSYTDPLEPERVIAGYYSSAAGSNPWGSNNDRTVTIAPYCKIITPDDIDMSDKMLTLRVSVKTTSVNINNPSLESQRMLPFSGYVKITPLKRKGGTHIPTPWKSKIQNDSLSEILANEREVTRFWNDASAPFPTNAVCPISLIDLNFAGNSNNDQRPISGF